MVKKVALDTLEIKEKEPDIPLPESILPGEEKSGEKSAAWRIPKWLWIAPPALVLLIVAGGGIYWRIIAPRAAHRLPSTNVPSPAVALPQARPLTTMVNDFILPLQDDKGRYLVMTCDLTFELSAGQDTLFRQNMVEVRKIIYEILKKTRVVSLLEPRSRDGLKEEISKAVNALLGQKAITAIYFTKFVVL